LRAKSATSHFILGLVFHAGLIVGLGLTGAAADAAAQTPTRAETEPVPVIVVAGGDIEEQTLVRPSDFAPVLDEMRGLRVQSTSPELGTAMVRVRGLRGQYTRLLSDGLPFYWDHPGGLALMQIPAMDVAHVDILTDGASARYGANALSGVVNLLSARPGKKLDRELLFNQSLRGATDGVLWISSPPKGSWSSTFLAGGHYQDERDVNNDGWSDLPGYRRGVARTSLFWDNGHGRSAWGTASTTFEKREGGSAFAHQSLETKEAAGKLVGQMPLGNYLLAGGATLYVQSRIHDFSDAREHERRQSATFELTLGRTAGRHTFLVGLAADWFALRTPEPLVSASIAPREGLFAHDDVQVARWLSVSGSVRVDHNNGASQTLRVDENRVSPRGSALVHGGAWAAGVSAGQSYSIPTTLTEETEAAGYARLSIAGPFQVETMRSVSADLTHETRGSTVTFTAFHSRIDHPALVDRTTYTLHTDKDPVITRGIEVFGAARRPPFIVTATYAYVDAQERNDIEVALTPRHSAAAGATIEGGRHGRIRAQVRFTGVQRLDANPYRSESEPYATLDVIGERPFGRVRVFATAVNLTNVRQTQWDPIARPTRDVDGRWTVDAWAPLVGRVINIGLKVSF
jgi:iron complex outermembrane receptor protein